MGTLRIPFFFFLVATVMGDPIPGKGREENPWI